MGTNKKLIDPVTFDNKLTDPVTFYNNDSKKDPNIIVIGPDSKKHIFGDYIIFKYKNISIRMEKNHTVYIDKSSDEIWIKEEPSMLPVGLPIQQEVIGSNESQQNNHSISPRDIEYLLLFTMKSKDDYYDDESELQRFLYVEGRQSAVDTILIYIKTLDLKYCFIMSENMCFKDCVPIVSFLDSCVRNNSNPNLNKDEYIEFPYWFNIENYKE